MNKNSQIIQKMIISGDLPENFSFEVTDELISKYCNYYNILFSNDNGIGSNPTNKRYARKLAALNLLKVRKSTSILVEKNKVNYSRSGFIYLISNPSFPNCLKVGITRNIQNRLKIYQTYDPFRSYKIEHYEFCENLLDKEKEILNKFSIDIFKGEWIPDNRSDILKVLFEKR